MNEAQWLASADPRAMIEWGLGPATRMRWASDRKLRLIALAITRHGGCGSWASVGHLVRAAEAMAEGQPHDLTDLEIHEGQQYVAAWLVEPDAASAARRIIDHYEPDPEDRASGREQAALVRCIVGSPFRSVVPRCPPAAPKDWESELAMMSWRTRRVRAIAQQSYDSRDFSALPILADAMEDAGAPTEDVCQVCEVETSSPRGKSVLRVNGVSLKVDGKEMLRVNLPQCRRCHGTGRLPSPLLAHLRGPGPHARGCWAVDLVLGRE